MKVDFWFGMLFSHQMIVVVVAAAAAAAVVVAVVSSVAVVSCSRSSSWTAECSSRGRKSGTSKWLCSRRKLTWRRGWQSFRGKGIAGGGDKRCGLYETTTVLLGALVESVALFLLQGALQVEGGARS